MNVKLVVKQKAGVLNIPMCQALRMQMVHHPKHLPKVEATSLRIKTLKMNVVEQLAPR